MATPAFRSVFAPAVLVLFLSCAALCRGQAFPCPPLDSDSPTPPGGYQNIETYNSNDDVEGLLGAVNASFTAYVNQDSDNLICNNTDNVDIAAITLLQACTQVVAGTNYGLKYQASYTCEVDADTSGRNTLVLNSVVYEPLPSDSNAEPTYEVQSVSRDRTFSAKQSTTEELPAEASPEGAPAAAPTDASGEPVGSLGSFSFPGLRKLML